MVLYIYTKQIMLYVLDLATLALISSFKLERHHIHIDFYTVYGARTTSSYVLASCAQSSVGARIKEKEKEVE